MEIKNLHRCGGKTVYCITSDKETCLLEFEIDYDNPNLEILVQDILWNDTYYIIEENLSLEKKLTTYCLKLLSYKVYLYYSIDRELEDIIEVLKTKEKIVLDGSQGIKLQHADFEDVLSPNTFTGVDESIYAPKNLLRNLK